jgi:hypothetical protein
MMTLFATPELHTYLRCLVLALSGFGYALFQFYVRPPREILLKRLVIALAFVLWAIEQLIPPGRLTLFLDDTVIGGFVLDLIWMIQGQRKAGSRLFVTSLSRGTEGLETPEKRESLRVQ